MLASAVIHPATKAAIDRYLAHPAQSVLITGPTGSGLTTVAHIVAARLLDVAAENLQNYPYVLLIRPENEAISISAIRDIQQFVSLQVPSTRQIGRIILIDDAHAMTREAQNALLKLLEEPPRQTVLLLVSSRPRLLLPTIISRVQQLRISRPDENDVVTHLEKRGYEKAIITKLLLASSQNVAETVRQLESGSEQTEHSIALAKQALAAEPFERLVMVDKDLKDKTIARDFVRTLSIIASRSSYGLAQRSDEVALRRWQVILTAVEKAAQALARNGNQKLVLTELMLSL